MDLSEKADGLALAAYYEYCFKLREIVQNDRGPKKHVRYCAAQFIDFSIER